MTFSYGAGTSTPTYAGLVEWGGLRINDGTFRSEHLPPVTDGAPLRAPVTTLAADHGGTAGLFQLDPWTFDLTGWLLVADPDDVTAAIDYLRSVFTISAGEQTATFDTRGWSATRQMGLRLAGPVLVTEPDLTLRKVPRRDFIVPMMAIDPRLYSTTLHSQSLSTAGSSVTNAGNVETPVTVRFNGPVVNPSVRDPDGLLISYAGTIASGHYVEVTTNPATDTGITALSDLGANVYGDITVFKARVMAPGTSTWSKVIDSGAGAVTLSWRDAWA